MTTPLAMAMTVLAATALFAGTARSAHGYYLQAGIAVAHQTSVDELSDDFSNAFGVSGELGKFLSHPIALSLRVNYQNNNAKKTTSGFLGSYKTTTWDTDIIEVLVDVTIWIPRNAGLLLGAGAGISRCSVNDVASDIKWITSGPVFDVFFGAQNTFKNEFMLFLRIGYTYRDFGVIAGREFNSSEMHQLGLDFSAVYVEVGFGGNTRRGWGTSR